MNEPTQETRRRDGPPYARMEPTFWEKAKQRGWSSDDTLLGCYLQSNSSKLSEGLYYLTIERMRADLPRGWKMARIRKSLARLEEDGFAFYDECAGVVFLPDALRIQKTANPNVRIKAIRRLASLSETPLWRRFVEAAGLYDRELQDVLRAEFPERLGAAEWGWDNGPQPLRQPLRQPLLQPQALTQTQALSSSSDSGSVLETQYTRLEDSHSCSGSQGSVSNSASDPICAYGGENRFSSPHAVAITDGAAETGSSSSLQRCDEESEEGGSEDFWPF